ncbi:MAG: hypothetical protein ACSNEK_05885 [Parachlamydiaceae bacterium]
MKVKNFVLKLLLATMVLSTSKLSALSTPREYCDYDAYGYYDCRRACCLIVSLATGAAVFAGIYAIVLEDSKGSSSHAH